MTPLRILILPLLLFYCSAIAQPKHLQYFNVTNKAQMAIFDSNFLLATNLYKEAFSINPDKTI